jgi:flagellar protein FlbT
MTVEEADTPCRRVYLVVQLMYLSRDPQNHHDAYFKLVKEIIAAAPSTSRYFDRVNNQILTGNSYKALKEAQSLIEYEKELLANA